MFAPKVQSPGETASGPAQAPAMAPGRSPPALAALADRLNRGPHVAQLAQLRGVLNPVVQRVKEEERAAFVEGAMKRVAEAGLDGEHLRNMRATVKFLSMSSRPLAEAQRKLDIEFARTHLGRKVAEDEAAAVPGLTISNRVAEIFGTTVEAVVDRYVPPFLDEHGKLPDGFLKEVHHWAALGARDVEAIITDDIGGDLVDKKPDTKKYWNRLDRFISANMNFGKYYGKEPQGRQYIHFIWSGRPISKGALANIMSWAERAKGTSWQVILWSDTAISNWVEATPLLKRAGVRLIDVKGVVDPRFDQAYAFARKHNLAGASDLIRLSVLNRHGGMYVDVDIGPGAIDLANATTPGPLERPQLAPGIRDADGVRTLLGLAPHTPVTAEHVKAAERRQRSTGTANNNFIASAAKPMAMNPIINHIAKATKTMDESAWQSAGGFIAGVSGPMAIGGVLDLMTDKGQLPKKKPSDSITAHPLEWLTPESEDQQWSH
jgi:hypothetical protein